MELSSNLKGLLVVTIKHTENYMLVAWLAVSRHVRGFSTAMNAEKHSCLALTLLVVSFVTYNSLNGVQPRRRSACGAGGREAGGSGGTA